MYNVTLWPIQFMPPLRIWGHFQDGVLRQNKILSTMEFLLVRAFLEIIASKPTFFEAIISKKARGRRNSESRLRPWLHILLE